MPFSKRPTEPGNVILLSAEDDTRSVLRPRLRLAGADLNRVRVPPVYRESDGEMLYDIPSCVDKLERMVRRQKAVLIVIDPLMSFLPENVNPNSDPQIRKALFPLAKMAERTGVATLLLRHPNKKLNLPALYRGSGSLGGIAGVVRSGLIVVEYPLDPELCVLAVTKANYYRKRKSLVFRLEPVTNETARVKWQEIMDVNADDLCSSQKRPIGRAMVFLKRTVTKPKVSSVELTRLAKKKGIAPRTLARARKKLHIKAEKKGFGEKGEWSVGPPKTSRAR
jgi:hypothetical protein